MIVHNIIYNGVDLSDTNSQTNNLVVQDVQKTVEIRTEIFNKQNTHGATTTNSLASGRLFTFTGTIFGDRPGSMNGQNVLNNMLTLDGYHELSFEDDGADRFKINAKVYSMPVYTATLDNEIVQFSFELYAEDPTLVSFTDKQALGGYGSIGGTTLGVELGTTLSDAIGIIQINHLGNFRALTKVSLIGTILNPKVYNYANSGFYKLNRTTADLIIDNRVNPTIVTDSGINVKADRAVGSTGIILEPGINNILVLGDDYSAESPLIAKIEYNDSYINS